MPIFIRRIIFAFFVCIFFVSAALILFYGSGYRWNGAKGRIEKTGQLSLDSKPRGAEVFLNGEPLRNAWKKILGSSLIQTTPASIQNLLPGEYTMEIRKEGYYAWKKTARVFSGQTTLFHGIRLLKNEIPQRIVTGDILQFSLLSDDRIAVLTDEDLFIFNTRQKTLRSLFHSDTHKLLSFAVRKDGNQFFIHSNDMQWIVNIGGKSTVITRDKTHAFLGIRWLGDDGIFGKTKDGISKMSLDSFISKKVVSGHVDDFFIRDERLFTIEGEKKKSVNMRELKSIGKPPIEILSLPMSGGLFLDESSHDIVIQKNTGGIAILSLTSGKNAFNVLELESISQLSRKKDGVFLGWSDVELWKYTLSGREYGKTLVTRQSTSLQKAFFSRIVPAVFFLSNNTVTMINMSDATKGDQMQLFKWNRIVDMELSENEKEFLISGTFEGAKGLYRLSIID